MERVKKFKKECKSKSKNSFFCVFFYHLLGISPQEFSTWSLSQLSLIFSCLEDCFRQLFPDVLLFFYLFTERQPNQLMNDKYVRMFCMNAFKENSRKDNQVKPRAQENLGNRLDK